MDECYDRLVTHDDVKDLPDIPWHSDLSNFRWPRYQNGEYVNFGDALPQFADTIYKTVKTISFNEDGVIAIGNAGGSAKRTVILKPGERVECKCVVDVDGVPIKKGDTVYEVGKSSPAFIVTCLPEPGAYRAVQVMYPSGASTGFDPERLTHVKPEPPRTCEDCRYWQRDPDCHNLGVCWVDYAERDGKDTYRARLCNSDICKCFKRRGSDDRIRH